MSEIERYLDELFDPRQPQPQGAHGRPAHRVRLVLLHRLAGGAVHQPGLPPGDRVRRQPPHAAECLRRPDRRRGNRQLIGQTDPQGAEKAGESVGARPERSPAGHRRTPWSYSLSGRLIGTIFLLIAVSIY